MGIEMDVIMFNLGIFVFDDFYVMGKIYSLMVIDLDVVLVLELGFMVMLLGGLGLVGVVLVCCCKGCVVIV